MKYKTNKLSKLEKERFSIFTNNFSYCYFCKKPKQDLHEILYGSNRRNSMKYGFVLPLCREHHNLFHQNQNLTKEWSAKCQKYFEQKNNRDDWLSIFHKNYIE